MKSNLSYKKLFVFLTIIFGIILTSTTYITFNYIKKSDIHKISNDNLKKSISYKKSFMSDYFKPYKNSINAISSNITLEKYLNNPKKEYEDFVKELFSSYLVTFENINQIELLNKNNKNTIQISKNSKIKNVLSSKNKKELITKFEQFSKNNLYVSTIDFNSTNLITIDFVKQITKNYFIVINVDLKHFFNTLKDSRLYDVFLINKKGDYLLYKNSNLELNTIDNSTIYNDFSKREAKRILNNNLSQGKDFISTFTNINNQNYILILKMKYKNQNLSIRDSQNFIFIVIFLSFIILIPLAIYFATIPDKVLKEYEKKLITHNITGLKNSIYLEKMLEKNSSFAKSIVILVYINNCKKLQSVYGYTALNKILKEAGRLISSYKENDQNFDDIYSLESNIFAIKYKYSDENQLIKFTQLLFNDLENIEILIDKNSSVYLDLTLGISNPKNLNSKNKLHEAQMALDYAIEKRIDILVYDPNIKSEDINSLNLKILKSIKTAIDKDNVILHYQAIYNNRTQKIEKFETLMRIKNSKNEILYPNSFMDIAKDSKKYNKLTYAMIEKSFKYFQDKDYEFSINLSFLDIVEKGFTKYLEYKINEYGVAKKLVIEIVESESISNYKEIKRFISTMKELGCKIAIDDFGSGYANFQHIISLSQYIDYIKFDGSLIRNIHKDRKSQLLVGVIKFLCDSLGIRTIAEFVEDEETLKFVDSMGINYSQGYHISKPVSNIENIPQ